MNKIFGIIRFMIVVFSRRSKYMNDNLYSKITLPPKNRIKKPDQEEYKAEEKELDDSNDKEELEDTRKEKANKFVSVGRSIYCDRSDEYDNCDECYSCSDDHYDCSKQDVLIKSRRRRT